MLEIVGYQGHSSLQATMSESAWLSQHLCKVLPTEEASTESDNKEAVLPSLHRPNEKASRERRVPKHLPDPPFKETSFLDTVAEDESSQLTPHPVILKQAHQKGTKPLPSAPSHEIGKSGIGGAANQSPQVHRQERNESASSIEKVSKPLPKVPVKDTPLVTTHLRAEERVTAVSQPTTCLIPNVSAEKVEVIPSAPEREGHAPKSSYQKREGSCSQVSVSAKRQHPHSKVLKTLPEVLHACEGSVADPESEHAEKPPWSENDQKILGHSCLIPKLEEGLEAKSANSDTPVKPLPDIPPSSVNFAAVGLKKAIKPSVVPRQARRPAVTLVEGHLFKPLSRVLEEGAREESPALQASPKPLPRVPKQQNLEMASQKKSLGSTDASSKASDESQDIVNEVPSVSSASGSSEPLGLDFPDETKEQTVKEQPTTSATSKTVKAATVKDTERFLSVCEDTSFEDQLMTSESDLWSDTEGASTLEKTVIPLRQNKLLQLEDQDKAASNRGQVRRTSSTDELPVVSVSFTNTRGLFQKAQLMNSCDSLDSTAKPPVAQKPLISKKPAVNTGQDGTTNKPNVPPKVTLGSPPRTIPKPLKLPPKASEQPNRDNIYDEVYHEETIESEPSSYSHDKASSKKLEKILGPDFATSDPARPSIERDIKPVKGKQPMDPRSRKISAPARPTTDDGPYAVIPLPDADKTATKKTKNSAEQKAREISDGNGNKVVLRNSGGMSSGDSGIVGLNTDMLVKRGISRKERRMSRRILRQTIRSMDSDFMEDSDDEPIGVDSDFDSDTSLEEPAVFMDESHKTAFEVLTTERTYVDTLYLINEIFLKGIEKENQKQHWFPPTVVNEIFSNISSIYRLHSAVLLPDLDERLKDWERNPCLGEVLKKNAPFLKLYSDYVSNFDNAMKQLNQWMSKVPKFAATVSQLQNHELCGNLALQHHMLTPVQRIPRYELLLKDYIKKLPDGSKDKADADKALTIISGAAQHSNDMMKSMDQFEKLLKINQKIDGENIIDPTRHLLKEGKITKIAAKNKEPQDRYIFLFNDILLCCEKKRLLTSANYKVKLKMEVDGMKVLDSNSCRFIIESKTKSIEFQTNSEEEREDWMRVLLSAIQEMYWKKETFRTNDAVGDRQNGDEYGVKAKFVPGESCPRWIKDDETSMCMRCGTDFKLTKRRHHCRACGAVVCHKCSNFEAPLEYDDNKMNKVCIKCYYVIKGDEEEIKKLARRSLIPEIDEDNSFSSFLYLHYKGAWTKFWVVVTEQDMFVLKAPKDVRPVFTLPIKLYNIRNINDTDAERDHVFKLSDSRTVHTLSAESKELKRRWMTVLSEGVEKVIKQATI
ncbi:FYVE, RhoGEF and PH domain-containing protein 1-like isoform X2 [Acanthaster planci]|uniref:FYVE, RhoGEF and PH domain-containing protein 1-like isoform X2 n=1 Tax=Acanthaster planci TaxID=133434 RepID=A0A8B7Z715_ACAPL|nr:FYVE, RhoGEF and PH domain-containing protein 1-like isoform X2 [Acanthaster planci]